MNHCVVCGKFKSWDNLLLCDTRYLAMDGVNIEEEDPYYECVECAAKFPNLKVV